MAIGKLFKSLLGGADRKSHPPVEPVDYKGFSIEPEPIDEKIHAELKKICEDADKRHS